MNNGLNESGDKFAMIRTVSKKIVVLFILMVVSVFSLNVPVLADEEQSANPIKFETIFPQDSLTIGDDIKIHIKADYPGNIELTPPSGQISDDVFILKSGPEVKSKTRGGRKCNDYTYTLTAFETGALEIPAFEFFWYDSLGNQHSVFSPTKPIYIISRLPADASGLDIKDIIGPKPLPGWWWPYIIIGFVILMLVALAYFLYRRKIKAIEIPQVPPEPPYDIVIRELTLLKGKDLPGKGKIKQYYIELSNIIRLYIEGRFNIDAVEATTYELKKVFKHPELPREKAL